MPLLDVPPGAPHPFEPAGARYFVRRTANGACSRLFDDEAPLADLDVLGSISGMGYTNLWVMERALLRVDGATHRWPPAPRRAHGDRVGRFFVYGDDGSRVEHHHDRAGAWVLGFATLDEAEEALDAEALAGAAAILVARLCDDVYWH